jgi:hypothetical protein
MVSIPHPPDSPDLASNHFSIFLIVKGKLEYAGITDEDQLFEDRHTILRLIPGEELEMILEAW